MNCACPDTGLCIDPGVWAWLKCSSSRPGFKASRGAAKEDVFKLAFVAYRIRDGILDKELTEEEWNRCVGNDYYADEMAFASFRSTINGTINGPFHDDEIHELERDPEERFLDGEASSSAASTPAASPTAASP